MTSTRTPVSDAAMRAITFLVREKRPEWDAIGIEKQLEKVRHLDVVDVANAALRAADDRELKTPGPIGNPAAPCWRERVTGRPEPREPYFGPWCDVCGQKPPDRGGLCLGHAFRLPVEQTGERPALRKLMHDALNQQTPVAPDGVDTTAKEEA